MAKDQEKSHELKIKKKRTLYDTFSCLIQKHFLSLHKKYNIIHYLI